MVIVQDSLLGAYKMTYKTQFMSKQDFMQCIMHISHEYDYMSRLAAIKSARGETERQYSTHALFGFIFPPDFHVKYPEPSNLTIRNGIVLDGIFDKTSLKGGKTAIIRLLCMEYNCDVASKFIDNIQFLTNHWLTNNPFSIGIDDCVMRSHVESKQEIKNTIKKYFIEANKLSKSSDHPQIREGRVNCSLNKAKDIGLKIAKSALMPDNNFIFTVKSGSKGDFFNIAQITGTLGQQNLEGCRPLPCLDNNQRSLPHMPRVIVNDVDLKYRSRGFVSSSFIDGMDPMEMFFHAMTGREGIIKTAMGTADTGYIQRSIVKLNEDLKVEYDGSVRDARKNIYQFAYGNHGFDPALININHNSSLGEYVVPIDIERLADRLNTGFSGDTLCVLDYECIESIISECSDSIICSKTIPIAVFDDMKKRQSAVLRYFLNRIVLNPSIVDQFKSIVIQKYHTSRVTPGECVGIIGAQSIGERQTQTMLNTFHTAGKLQQSGTKRLEEILRMTKKLKIRTCTLYFNENSGNKDKTPDLLRKNISSSIVGLTFADLQIDEPVTLDDENQVYEFKFDPKVMFVNRISPAKVAMSLSVLECVECHVRPMGVVVVVKACDKPTPDILANIDKVLVCGMKGVKALHLDHDGKEWFAVTEGSNLRQMLIHPLIDNNRIYCNDTWEVYECLGLAATRKMLMDDLKKVVSNVNTLHLQLLVDKMTFKGKPSSVNRYTMRSNDVGPLSRATFEESTDILINAAMKTEIENNAGVSAAIISGNQPKVGTGFMKIIIDHNKIMTHENDKPEGDVYY
jgi:DNA-directed RNA polymerase beta' subunit